MVDGTRSLPAIFDDNESMVRKRAFDRARDLLRRSEWCRSMYVRRKIEHIGRPVSQSRVTNNSARQRGLKWIKRSLPVLNHGERKVRTPQDRAAVNDGSE
jgi:hypothetical protein